MEAIILAGGLGTRLRSVVKDVPKPMALVGNKPFLWYLLEALNDQEIEKVVLAVGYKYEVIKEYFGDKYKNIKIEYSIEDEPLGTGGCIKKAFEKIDGDNVLILNGDTYFNVDLRKLKEKHIELDAELTLSVKPMEQFERYGTVVSEQERVIDFEEKQYKESGNINAGVYIAKTNIFKNMNLDEKFSFEKDVMEKYVSKLKIGIYISDEYFIDIGIPKDYEKAQTDFKLLFEEA